MSFEEHYADLLDVLSPVNRRAVIRSVTNAMLEGWNPTREQVQRQVNAAVNIHRGSGEYIAEILAANAPTRAGE